MSILLLKKINFNNFVNFSNSNKKNLFIGINIRNFAYYNKGGKSKSIYDKKNNSKMGLENENFNNNTIDITESQKEFERNREIEMKNLEK